MTERRRAERRRAEIDWKFYKKVFWLALPIALQSLITIGVNMLDTIMVGNLGEMSLSAVSLANQFIGVYQIFCMGLGMGASVLVSRYWGMQEAEPVKSIQALRKTICIVVRITVSLALLFAVVTLLIPQVVMRMYTQDAEIIQHFCNSRSNYVRSAVCLFLPHRFHIHSPHQIPSLRTSRPTLSAPLSDSGQTDLPHSR